MNYLSNKCSPFFVLFNASKIKSIWNNMQINIFNSVIFFFYKMTNGCWLKTKG